MNLCRGHCPMIVRALATVAIAMTAIGAMPTGMVAQSAMSTPTISNACLAPTATPSGGMTMPVGTPEMKVDGHAAHGEATPAATPPFDLAFIDLMGPHHEGAILMSQVALDRAEHPEIEQLAREIITAQQREQQQMRAWRDAWYPRAPTYSMDALMAAFDQQMAAMEMAAGHMGHMDPAADAAALCAAGGPFDLAFMTMMISHHEAAVMMAEVALHAAQHPELRTFAQQVIDAQTVEIEEMRGWIAAWYPSATPAS